MKILTDEKNKSPENDVMKLVKTSNSHKHSKKDNRIQNITKQSLRSSEIEVKTAKHERRGSTGKILQNKQYNHLIHATVGSRIMKELPHT